MKLRYGMARPHITKADKRAVERVLDSGILSIGPNVEKFEKAFARQIGTRYAVAVSSGTAGLHCALIAAGITEGDEIITTPFSFVASANAILYVGAKPVFVDVDPVTYNMDPALIEKKITKKTRAILVVHIFGQPCDMAPIQRIAKKYGLTIIEDACESLLSTYRGKKAGTFGESSVFAFYANKQMTTGEGGMVCTNDARVARLCKSLRNQGRGENMQWLDHNRLGYNYRMDEMSAALGLSQMSVLASNIRERRRVARLYEKYLKSHERIIQVPRVAGGNTHTYFVYVVQLLKPGVRRDDIIEKLKRRGIASKPYLPSIHLFSFYKKRFGFKRGDFPISEGISDRALALPLYRGLTERDVKRIVATLTSVI